MSGHFIVLSNGKIREIPAEAREVPAPAAAVTPRPSSFPPNPKLKLKPKPKPKPKTIELTPTDEAVLGFVCSKCGRRTDRLHSDSYCSTCNNLKTIERQRRFKRACVEHCGGACPCGEARDHVLVFLHKLAGSNSRRISRLVGGVPLSDAVLKELDSCEMFCRNCSLLKQFGPGSISGDSLKAICARAMGGCCSHCGYRDSLAALEFHHLDPTGKLVTIGGRKRSGAAARTLKPREVQQALLEASKCVLVCSNCHADSHYQERNFRYENEGG